MAIAMEVVVLPVCLPVQTILTGASEQMISIWYGKGL
jgi:hypothetical protein